jgi:hypothetical protein
VSVVLVVEVLVVADAPASGDGASEEQPAAVTESTTSLAWASTPPRGVLAPLYRDPGTCSLA